jgi:hypothetical protein
MLDQDEGTIGATGYLGRRLKADVRYGAFRRSENFRRRRSTKNSIPLVGVGQVEAVPGNAGVRAVATSIQTKTTLIPRAFHGRSAYLSHDQRPAVSRQGQCEVWLHHYSAEADT